MSAVIERVEQPRAVQAATAVTPSQLLQLAMDKGVDLDRLEKLYALQREWEAHEARKAYIAAMAQFKENVPTILKDKHVSFETQKGVTEYDHATLGGVCEALISALAKVGITHDWDPDTRDPARIAVTCTLTHVLGHSKSVTLHAAPDNSGGKNSIQASSSTITYLERYSLLAAAGVATKDMPDDDGRGAGESQDEKEKPPAPDGYANWRDHMEAKAREGKQPHIDAFKASPENFRLYACDHDREWWEGSKAKAARVQG